MQQPLISAVPESAGVKCPEPPTVDDSAGVLGRTTPTDGVGGDAEREQAIRFAGEQFLAWMDEWERTSCFAARGTAEFWLLRQSTLIRGRSAAQVRAMEEARGLLCRTSS